jgi:hypothetical protein
MKDYILIIAVVYILILALKPELFFPVLIAPPYP